VSTVVPRPPRSATTGVVILNHGDHGDTLTCLESLELSDDLDLDIVVVDNGPATEEHQALRAAVGSRATTIATGDNLGYAAGNNVGIARLLERDCDLVWILNPDTIVEPSTLPRLREHLADVPDCGVVGPRILLADRPHPTIWFDGGVVDRTLGSTAHINQGKRVGDAPPVTADVDYVTGASMLVRRSMIEHIGPIPSRYFLYYEEVDWCLRAQASGWRTMIHRAAGMTHRKRSSARLPQPYYVYYMTRNRYLFAQDCLGVDGEVALASLDEVFLRPWRKRVEQAAPEWVDAFDELVRMAKEDARAGLDGRNDLMTDYPPSRTRA
jgi:GT2 family glycosyltransferase